MSETKYVFVSTEDDRHLVKGGIGTSLGVLTRALARRGHRVDWVTQSPDSRDFEELHQGVRYHFVGKQDSLGGWRGADDFIKRLERRVDLILTGCIVSKTTSPVVVEAPDWEGLLAESFARWEPCDRLLRVTRIHTPLAVCMRSNRLSPSRDNREQIARERRQMEHSDLLSSPTLYTLESTLDSALDGVAPCPTVVIGNCINPDAFRPGLSTSGAALQLLESLTGVRMSPGALRIFVLGSVEYRKGVTIVQRAIPALLDLDRRIELCWLGHYSTDGREQLTANNKLTSEEFFEPIPAQLRGRVHLGGYLDYRELPRIHAAGDLFLFCYLMDNFPGALTEVGLTERPMIALMKGGIPEIISRQGQPLALTVTGDDEAFIAQQVVTCVGEYLADPGPAMNLAHQLGNHLRETFDSERILDQRNTQYEWALARKHDHVSV